MNYNYTNQPNLEDLYPEIYINLHPHVLESINEMRQKGWGPTRDRINFMVDDVVMRSGMWDEDEMDDPPLDPPHSGHHSHRRRRRGYHNRNTLRDLSRILILKELLR